MRSGNSPNASSTRPLLRVVPIARGGGWQILIDGLPPSGYATKAEACAEAEAYVAGHARGGEIVVGSA